MLRLALAGSTGSIGRQTLDVVSQHQDQVKVVALVTNHSVDSAVDQAISFQVERLYVGDEGAKDHPALDRLPDNCRVFFGKQAIADLPFEAGVDMVLNALVGAAGLMLSYNSLKAGLTLALANKESLVVGGDLIMPLATHETLLPVDSEHSAIYQCLLGEDCEEVERIWITASGGPFRGRTREELATVTPQDALAHPTWSMGPKISIDSSTLMNKGLEIIEAHHLFSMPYDRIQPLIHPQSCIHSMVEFSDGTVKAHLGATDMRVPIQYALSFPHRWCAPVEPVDFCTLGHLTFDEPDLETFGCLRIAVQAGKAGGTAPCVLNAANEVAVAAFLEGSCGFLDIEATVEAALGEHQIQKVESLEQLAEVDAWARAFATSWLQNRS